MLDREVVAIDSQRTVSAPFLGIVPLIVAEGAGSKMRKTLGLRCSAACSE